MTPRTLTLADGRRLAWSELGDPGGTPVLAFHGTPACRLLFMPAHEPARLLGLRLVAPDRPGYGLSDPLPGRTFAGWAADTAALMDHLAIARAPILAVSGGSPYAVTTAACLGPRVSALALVSPLGEIAHPAIHAKLSRRERALFLGLPSHPRVLRRSVQWGRAAFLAAPELSLLSFVTALSPADRRVLSAPAARRLVLAMTREAMRQGIEGVIADLELFSRTWRVDPASITVPAVLWQGTADAVVPAGAAFDLAHRLGNCHVVRLEGHGHFWVVDNVAEVVSAVSGMLAGARRP
ncbi:MAG: alpha/beta hydrolase [Hyphomicrobiaceae bacterium]|nr:alpha/beta hydrolase [Hyphomicrobiaceae bacterium]